MAGGNGGELEHGKKADLLRGTQAGLGIYPFMEGKLEDLEEVFDHFKNVSQRDILGA